MNLLSPLFARVFGIAAVALLLTTAGATWAAKRLYDSRAAVIVERDAARAEAQRWQASFRAAEAVRQTEQARAVQAADALQASCQAQVAEARRSASAIRTIIEREPARDPQGCPVRRLLDPDELRRAIQPDAR